jgi:adenylate cyclase
MVSTVERKLTTILSADVVGYSQLMGQDESGTLATLKAHREVMRGLIGDHRGRVVNTAGDSVLAEFASVVNAVDCAVKVQREIAERNAALPDGRAMWLRIGINLGDVMVDGDDLFGDGVNVAARLQALADPGGVLISGTVFDHVRDKLSLGFDYLGPQSVKNMAAQVPIYRVLLQPGAVAPPPPSAPMVPGGSAEQEARRHRLYTSSATAGAFVALFLAINLFSWDGDLWFQWPSLPILFVYALRLIRLYRPPKADHRA